MQSADKRRVTEDMKKTSKYLHLAMGPLLFALMALGAGKLGPMDYNAAQGLGTCLWMI